MFCRLPWDVQTRYPDSSENERRKLVLDIARELLSIGFDVGKWIEGKPLIWSIPSDELVGHPSTIAEITERWSKIAEVTFGDVCCFLISHEKHRAIMDCRRKRLA